MKVIDLLNKIANGEEVPKEVKLDDEIYIYDETDDNEILRYRTMTNNYLVDMSYLNDEVEVTEDKKIEKIDLFDNYSGYNWSNRELCEQIERNFVELNSKINEIIDKINKGD